jgi:hypothetical protein
MGELHKPPLDISKMERPRPAERDGHHIRIFFCPLDEAAAQCFVR